MVPLIFGNGHLRPWVPRKNEARAYTTAVEQTQEEAEISETPCELQSVFSIQINGHGFFIRNYVRGYRI